MRAFDALTTALEGCFDTAFADLPNNKLRKRVWRAFRLIPWDSGILSPNRRRSLALSWDYEHDPAYEAERQRGFDSAVRESDLQNQIAELEAAAAPTVLDIVEKRKRLIELRQELASVDAPMQAPALNLSVETHDKETAPAGGSRPNAETVGANSRRTTRTNNHGRMQQALASLRAEGRKFKTKKEAHAAVLHVCEVTSDPLPRGWNYKTFCKVCSLSAQIPNENMRTP